MELLSNFPFSLFIILFLPILFVCAYENLNESLEDEGAQRKVARTGYLVQKVYREGLGSSKNDAFGNKHKIVHPYGCTCDSESGLIHLENWVCVS
jgi:hypothetical protein